MTRRNSELEVSPFAWEPGRAANRRVEFFFDTSCFHSFFAQCDLRFLLGDPVFSVPAHPNIANKLQCEIDVGAVAAELVRRRGRRPAAAPVGTVPTFLDAADKAYAEAART